MRQRDGADEKGKITDDMYRIHAYIFVFDCSNKRTFDSLMCIIDTIHQLEKGKKKGAGGKAKKGAAQPFFPKKIVIGNKKDLKVNKTSGAITKNDISRLLTLFPTIKVKEVSALTNYNITDVFQQLVKELDGDPALKQPTEEYFNYVKDKIKGGKKAEGGEAEEGADEGEEAKKATGIADPDKSKQDGGFFGCCGARGGGGAGSDGDSSDENAQQVESSDDEKDTQMAGGMKFEDAD